MSTLFQGRQETYLASAPCSGSKRADSSTHTSHTPDITRTRQ
jgi:hypothetical protein